VVPTRIYNFNMVAEEHGLLYESIIRDAEKKSIPAIVAGGAEGGGGGKCS
jgi:hypothetical protein